MTISYATLTHEITDKSKVGYKITSPKMQIDVHQNSHYGSIRVIKEHPGDCESCESVITVFLIIPGEESRKIILELKKIIRPRTCDKQWSFQNSIIQLKCSKEVAYKALETISQLSQKYFGSAWLNESKKFIDNSEVATKERLHLSPELEQLIRNKFGNQVGAMNLLEDLKEEPFNEDIRRIFIRLYHGVYADFLKLILDLGIKPSLATRAWAGRYMHTVKSKL